MAELLSSIYLFLKSGHVIFMVFWLAGLFMLGLSMHLMAQHLAAYLHRLPEDLARITRLLAG